MPLSSLDRSSGTAPMPTEGQALEPPGQQGLKRSAPARSLGPDGPNGAPESRTSASKSMGPRMTLSSLPTEMLQHVAGFLGTTSLQNLAATSRRMHAATAQPRLTAALQLGGVIDAARAASGSAERFCRGLQVHRCACRGGPGHPSRRAGRASPVGIANHAGTGCPVGLQEGHELAGRLACRRPCTGAHFEAARFALRRGTGHMPARVPGQRRAPIPGRGQAADGCDDRHLFHDEQVWVGNASADDRCLARTLLPVREPAAIGPVGRDDGAEAHEQGVAPAGNQGSSRACHDGAGNACGRRPRNSADRGTGGAPVGAGPAQLDHGDAGIARHRSIERRSTEGRARAAAGFGRPAAAISATTMSQNASSAPL